MKKDKILFTILHVFVIFFVLFLKNIVVFPNDTTEMKFLEILLMGVYIYTFVTGKIYLDWLNSYMVFLYTLFLFNFTRIFLDIVGYREFGWATKFANYYFFNDVRIEIINVFIIVLLFTHLGFFIGIINEKIEIKEYQEDGLTAKYNNLLLRNPKGQALYHNEINLQQLTFRQKILNNAVYYKFCKVAGYGFSKIYKECYDKIGLMISLPAGMYMYWKGKKDL